MKILKNFMVILMMMMMFVMISGTVVRAELWSVTDFDGIVSKGTTGNLGDAAQNITASAIQIIRIVGTGISVIMLTYVAIKYMSAAPSEKADFKKSATAFVVGAIVLFAASNILSIIIEFADDNIVKP